MNVAICLPKRSQVHDIKLNRAHYAYVLNAFLTEPWALILLSSLTTVKLFWGELSYIVIEVV